MKKYIPKIIGTLQIMGGLYGIWLLIQSSCLLVIPVVFIILNLIAGTLLITKQTIGIPVSILIFLPQFIHVYANSNAVFKFFTPLSAGIEIAKQPDFTIGIFGQWGFAVSIQQASWPTSIEINVLALVAIALLLNNYNNEPNQGMDLTVKTPVDSVEGLCAPKVTPNVGSG